MCKGWGFQQCRETCALLHDPKKVMEEEILKQDVQRRSLGCWTARNKPRMEERAINIEQITWQIKRAAWEYKEFFAAKETTPKNALHVSETPAAGIIKIMF